jgi:methyl-accepting chemotaxis protein
MNRIIARYSIGARLNFMNCLAIAAIIGVGVLGYAWLASQSTRFAGFISRDFAAVQALGKAQAAIGNVRRYEKDLFLNLASAEDFRKYKDEWRAELKGAQSALDAVGKIGVEGHQARLDKIRAGLAGYQKGVESIIADVESRRIREPAAANKAMTPFKSDIRAADGAFAELARNIVEAADAQKAEIAQAASNAAKWMVTGLLLSLAITLPFAYFNGRSITRPLGEMVVVAKAVASGDLTQKIEPVGRDEIAALSTAMAEMTLALRDVVSGVRGSSEMIASASTQIANGNADLSARTESQASSLQQTAASMEQITSTVKQSSDNSRQATQLAASASEVAAKGGNVVGQVVSTMSDITESSKKITDIIGVIDGIAFQTNILALNAAVEAARAGEQGRGFAVVAGEVRTLAQRSAQAAKEIKTLIGDSVSKVDAGSRLVADAGSTMDEIVDQVKRVADLIGEITSATIEQSGGIEQVNQAVTVLDQTTQQNAALVEESAAAASSLKDQAVRLNQAVQVFKLAA